MRDDKTLSDSFRTSDIWDRQRYEETFLVTPEEAGIPKDDRRSKRFYLAHSLSGNERNRLFMQSNEGAFDDVSLISGLDNLSDGRSFALFDYNNDGWLDVALMSLNSPRFKLFENRFGKLFPENRSLRIKLIGGHSSADVSNSLSNRDAIGAKVVVNFSSGESAMFQRQAGEGFGSQNSSYIHVGVPSNETVSNVTVQWPSGKSQSATVPESSKLLTIEEDSE